MLSPILLHRRHMQGLANTTAASHGLYMWFPDQYRTLPNHRLKVGTAFLVCSGRCADEIPVQFLALETPKMSAQCTHRLMKYRCWLAALSQSLNAASEEAGLFHDADELLLIDLSIPISVCLINHFLQDSACLTKGNIDADVNQTALAIASVDCATDSSC